MKQLHLYLFVLLLGAGFGLESCKTTKESISGKNTPSVREHSVLATLWQQHAAEKNALCYQAYNIATERMRKYAKMEKSPLPPAVVLDIDETVLDNSPYNGYLIQQDENYSFESWKKWSDQEAAKPVPGSLEFIRTALKEEVEVFYISNRDVSELESTMANLHALGFPRVPADHYLFKDTTSNKEPRRRKVAEEYEIILLLGDNLGDFMHAFDDQSTEARNRLVNQYARLFGDRFIVFPNAMYGEWEGALYEYDWGTAPEEKDKIRKRKLKSF